MSDAAPAPSETVIAAVNLTKIYLSPASPIIIFENLSLDVSAGALIAVVGPSGAGKSTLLHLLGGLDRPTSGQVLFEGVDIFALDAVRLAEYRNRHIGFVFQFHHLLPEFTAVENAAMPLMIRGLGRDEALERASGILDRVGLRPRMEHKIGELSGGEQQRVAIARALVGDSELLLADEPTGNLDPATGKEVFDIVRSLHEERNLTSVIVTHNEQIASRCEQVWHIDGGQLRGT